MLDFVCDKTIDIKKKDFTKAWQIARPPTRLCKNHYLNISITQPLAIFQGLIKQRSPRGVYGLILRFFSISLIISSRDLLPNEESLSSV